MAKPTARAWPSLLPIAPGSPILEWWGGFAAPCSECGYKFVRPTPEAAAEAATTREGHGLLSCKQAAGRLTEEERAALEELWVGATPKPKAVKKKAVKA